MRIVRFHADGSLRCEDLPAPEPGQGEVLLAPQAVGVCGTDAHILDGHFPSRPPVALGHEVAAIVQDVGPGVTAVAPGDLVTVEPHLYCGICASCQLGNVQTCTDRRAPGVHLNGGMSELMVVPQTIAYRLPEGTPPLHGALTEPIACCVHAVDRLEAKSGLPVAVFGCGPAGAIITALCSLAGLAPIVVIDPRASRRDLALRVGADHVIDPSTQDVHAAAMELTGGVGFPSVIEAAGKGPVLEQAVGIAARSATILLFGVADPHDTATVRPNEIYTKELRLVGTALNPYTHRRAIGLLHRLPLNELRTVVYPLDKVPQAIDAQRAGEADKVYVEPQQVEDPNTFTRTEVMA